MSDFLAHFTLFRGLLILDKTFFFLSFLYEFPIEHLMQEGLDSDIEQKLGLNFHWECVPTLFTMLIDMRVLSHDIIGSSTTKSPPTEQAHPQSVRLIALLAESYNWRLLIVTTKRTSIVLPTFETVSMKIVTAKNRNYLTTQLLEADRTSMFLIRFDAYGLIMIRAHKDMGRRLLFLLALTELSDDQLTTLSSLSLIVTKRY